MLTPFGPDLWIADGPVVTAAAGFPYPTRMAVIRLGEGLAIWSPVALTPDLRAAVEALGSVRWLVPPNALHHVFLQEWAKAWPQADVLAPPGLRAKRKDIVFAQDLERPPRQWQGKLETLVMRGNRIVEEVVLFHHASGTALFADLLQNLPHGWFAGWRALVARLDGMTGPEPAVPRKFRVAFRDRAAARAALAQVLDWPVERVLMAHGTPVTSDGRTFLRRAFRWL